MTAVRSAMLKFDFHLKFPLNCSFRSSLLRQCTLSKAHSSEGRFPDLSSELAFFDVSVPLLSNFNTLLNCHFMHVISLIW
jgi:hypothetical protein